MELNKVYVGIDPGKEGAIVKILPDSSIEVIGLDQIAGEYNIVEISKTIKSLSHVNSHVVLEDVKALQRPYDSGNWSLSACKSMLHTLLIVYQIPHTLVSPKTWQKEMWQGIPEKRKPSIKVTPKKGEPYMKKGPILTKEMSLLACQRLFPSVDIRSPYRKTDRSRKPHDGTVDALLMAEYCRRKFR